MRVAEETTRMDDARSEMGVEEEIMRDRVHQVVRVVRLCEGRAATHAPLDQTPKVCYLHTPDRPTDRSLPLHDP